MVVLVVMGVCGCGKTTIGRALAEKVIGLHFDLQLCVPFCDADDYHSPSNVDKMSRGTPLSDQDRLPWLQALHRQLVLWETSEIVKSDGTGSDPCDRVRGDPCDSVRGDRCDSVRGVLACSALKQSYRDVLSGMGKPTDNLIGQLLFVYLRGSREFIQERVCSRDNHFMPALLVESQFNDLEEPTDQCVTVSIEQTVVCLVDQVVELVTTYLLAHGSCSM